MQTLKKSFPVRSATLDTALDTQLKVSLIVQCSIKLKKALREIVKLPPLDINRPLWVWLDAAKTKSDNEADGVTIISCDCTNFTADQKGYSAF